MQPIINYVKDPKSFVLGLVKKSHSFLPDSLYLKLLYYFKMGQVLHLNKPIKYTEKIQWLKLYDRKSEYTMMVDKIAVKKYVEKKIGKEVVIPIIAEYSSVDDIDFDKLPSQFVLKTNHSGGNTGVVICKDKGKLNIPETIEKLKESLKSSAYDVYLEWPYKDVKRQVFAEKYMEDETGNLMDYKFMCFNGRPRFVHICPDRYSGGQIHFDYYDMNWVKLPFTIEHPNSNLVISRPKSFEKMVEYSKILSAGIPLARIDFYEINGNPYFGEITFYPYSGMEKFDKEEWNITLGDWIDLSEFNK